MFQGFSAAEVIINVYSCELETTPNIFDAFPFAQISKYQYQKKKLHNNVFTTFKKRKRKYKDIDNSSQKRERCQIDW